MYRPNSIMFAQLAIIAVLLSAQVLSRSVSEKPGKGKLKPQRVQNKGMPELGLLAVSSNLPLLWSEGSYHMTSTSSNEVILNCTLTGILPSHAHLEWWEDEMALGNTSHRHITGDSCTISLHLSNLTFLDYGRYKCKIVEDTTSFDYGIPFKLEKILNPKVNVDEVTVNLLPNIPSGRTKITTVALRRKMINLQCTSSKSINNIVWTRIPHNGPSKTLSSNWTLRALAPSQSTKFMCHSTLSTIVHSIHYFYPDTAEHERPRIVYPNSETVNHHYTLDSLVRSEGEIGLCLIQPYTPQKTSTRFVYRQGNKTVRADAQVSPMLASWPWRESSVSMGSRLISGATTTSLLYFIRIDNVTGNGERLNRTLRFLTERVLTAGRFSCSAGNKNRVNFTVLLTEGRSHRTISKFCRYNVSRPIVQNTTEVIRDSSVSTEPAQIVVPINRSSLLIIFTVTAVAMLATVTSLAVCVCCLRRARGRRAKKMSPVQIKLLRSSVNPLFEIVPTISKEDKLVQELVVHDMFFMSESLTLLEDLGSGAFGIVKKAHLSVSPTNSITVAVKLLKDSFTPEDESDLVMEIKTLFHVGEHPNLVNLLGASCLQGKLCVLMEFCERGNLLLYLRQKRVDQIDPLTTPIMINMASQVANGMAYLAYKKCIHRDLAARNVLMTADYTLKIADFGLARKLYSSVYRPTAKRLPIKWLAPEGIIDGIFTTKSDVWSFGVLLWEIFTLGRTPYPGVPAHRVVGLVESGYRMPPPKTCPIEIYELMGRCWQMESTARPDFVDLMTSLSSVGTEYSQLHQDYYNVCECEDSCCQGGGHTSTLSYNQECPQCSAAQMDYANILPGEWFQATDRTRNYVGEMLCEHAQCDCICDSEHAQCDCISDSEEEYFSCESEISDNEQI